MYGLRDVKCDKFLILIRKLLKAGYLDPITKKVIKSNKGTPLGSIVSPLLANIVLDMFDQAVIENIMPDYIKGIRRKTNPEYNKWLSVRYDRKKGIIDSPESRKALLEMRKLPRHVVNDPNFRRSMYIRYADDFVYLFEGPRSEAIIIKQRLSTELLNTCGLELNENKTILSNMIDGFEFLGANIKKLKYEDEPIFTSHTSKGHVVKQRRAIRLRLNVPMKKLLDRLIENRIARRNKAGLVLATPNNSVILLSHDRIIQFYNQK